MPYDYNIVSSNLSPTDKAQSIERWLIRIMSVVNFKNNYDKGILFISKVSNQYKPLFNKLTSTDLERNIAVRTKIFLDIWR